MMQGVLTGLRRAVVTIIAGTGAAQLISVFGLVDRFAIGESLPKSIN